MKTKIYILITLFITIGIASSIAQSSNYHWVKGAGSHTYNSYIDKAGNIYMMLADRMRYCSGEENVPAGIYIGNVFYPRNHQGKPHDVYHVVKYNSAGQLIWRNEIYCYKTHYYDLWSSYMCVDKDENLYMLFNIRKGSNDIKIKFDNNTTYTPDETKEYVLLAKYNTDGSIAYTKAFYEYDYATYLFVSAKGYIYMKAHANDFIDKDALIKLDANANVIATIDEKYLRGSMRGISDSQGNVYIPGYSTENIVIDGTVYEPQESGRIIVKLDGETNRPLWLKTTSLAIGASDIFNDKEIVSLGGIGNFITTYIVKFDLETKTETKVLFEKNSNTIVYGDLCFDKQGNIFIPGYASETVQIANKIVPRGCSYIAKYTPDLKNLWVKLIDSPYHSEKVSQINATEQGDLLFTLSTGRSKPYASLNLGTWSLNWLEQSVVWGKCSGNYNVEANFETAPEQPDPNDLIPGAVWVYWEPFGEWIMVAKASWIWFGNDVIYPPNGKIRAVSASGGELTRSIQRTGSGKVQFYAEPNLSDTTRTDTITITHLNNPDIVERFVISQAPTTPTSINTLQVEKLVSVSPNPTSDYFVVSGINAATWVSVYDISGKKVMEKTVSPDEKISVSTLPKGIYLVKVNGQTAKLMVK